MEQPIRSVSALRHTSWLRIFADREGEGANLRLSLKQSSHISVPELLGDPMDSQMRFTLRVKCLRIRNSRRT